MMIGIEVAIGGGGRPAPHPPETHVFALAGQSNMVGQGFWDGGAPHPAGTLQWTQAGTLAPAATPLDHTSYAAGTMGLDVEFAREYKAARPWATIVFVPSAHNSTSFANDHWNPGNSHANALVARVNAAMAALPGARFKGVLWLQGESDAILGQHGPYEARLRALIQWARQNILAADAATPWVLGEMAPAFVTSKGASAVAVQAIITATPDFVTNTAFVSSAGLTAQDENLHFDAPSLRTLGSRYVPALAAAAGNAIAPSAPEQVTGLVVAAGDGVNGLSWAAPWNGNAPIGDYRVEVSVDAGATWTVLADGVSTLRSWTHTGLANGSTYVYRVAAVNAVGTGPASASASGTPAEPIAIDPEAGATAHWVFGTDNVAGVDLVAARTLAKQGDTPATTSSGYMSLADNAGGGDGFLTGIADTQPMTIAMVVRVPGGSNALFAGTRATPSDSGIHLFYSSAGSLFGVARGRSKSVAMAAGGFVFVAISVGANVVAFRGDPGGNLSSAGAAINTATQAQLSLGEVHFANGTYAGGFDVAEAVVWAGSALSTTELAAVYGRAKSRLSARGIVVL